MVVKGKRKHLNGDEQREAVRLANRGNPTPARSPVKATVGWRSEGVYCWLEVSSKNRLSYCESAHDRYRSSWLHKARGAYSGICLLAHRYGIKVSVELLHEAVMAYRHKTTGEPYDKRALQVELIPDDDRESAHTAMREALIKQGYIPNVYFDKSKGIPYRCVTEYLATPSYRLTNW